MLLRCDFRESARSWCTPLRPATCQPAGRPGQCIGNRCALRRHERARKDHLAHARRTELGSDSGHRFACHRMPDDHDIVEPCALEVGHHRVHRVGDVQRPQVARLGSTPGQVDGKDIEFRCQQPDFVDGKIPAVGCMHCAVHKHHRRQRHDYTWRPGITGDNAARNPRWSPTKKPTSPSAVCTIRPLFWTTEYPGTVAPRYAPLSGPRRTVSPSSSVASRAATSRRRRRRGSSSLSDVRATPHRRVRAATAPPDSSLSPARTRP
jgi:hypothetical protein